MLWSSSPTPAQSPTRTRTSGNLSWEKWYFILRYSSNRSGKLNCPHLELRHKTDGSEHARRWCTRGFPRKQLVIYLFLQRLSIPKTLILRGVAWNFSRWSVFYIFAGGNGIWRSGTTTPCSPMEPSSPRTSSRLWATSWRPPGTTSDSTASLPSLGRTTSRMWIPYTILPYIALEKQGNKKTKECCCQKIIVGLFELSWWEKIPFKCSSITKGTCQASWATLSRPS